MTDPIGSLEELWEERVSFRLAERNAYGNLPPAQTSFTFGDTFIIEGDPLVVGRALTLTELVTNTARDEPDVSGMDFLNACALYDAAMGWFAAECYREGQMSEGVVHASQVTPIPQPLYEALRKVGWNPKKLSVENLRDLTKAMRDDRKATQRHMESRGE